MPKPIKLTEKIISQMIKEFRDEISQMKMFDGKVNYNKNFSYKEQKEKATVLFSPTAYAKMLHLLMEWDSEIAWHGSGERISTSVFLISDILVYPQTVTGSTVEMDTEEYANWIIENIEDERFNNIIMQGHSHVNAGTSPSTVDITHQEQILEQLTDDMFYIFMIWNKKLDKTIKIYDMKNNILFEDDDIICNIDSDDGDIDNFIKDAKEQVKKKSYAPTPVGQSYYKGSKIRYKGKAGFESNWSGKNPDLMEDSAYSYYNS